MAKCWLGLSANIVISQFVQDVMPLLDKNTNPFRHKLCNLLSVLIIVEPISSLLTYLPNLVEKRFRCVERKLMQTKTTYPDYTAYSRKRLLYKKHGVLD